MVGDGNGAYPSDAALVLENLPRVQSPSVVIQRVMNLVMPIRKSSPETKAKLVMKLATERDAITTAMDNLGNVHFARFAIVGDDLHFLSVYDGTAQGYVHDFAVHLGPAFDAILGFIEDWPPRLFEHEQPKDATVSVRDHPAEFVEWVVAHDIAQLPRDPSPLLAQKLKEGDEDGPDATGLLLAALVERFTANPSAHLSAHRGYPGRTVAQIRDALDVGW